MKKAQKDMEDFQKKADETKDVVGGLFRELAGPVAQIGLGAGLGLFLKDSVQAAAGLQELHNKAEVVFGADFPKALAQADALAASLHRSSDDMLGFKSNFALVAEGLGIGSEQAGQMSESLTRLAVDFSKALGGTQEQAADAITMALQGNTRGLREYGIVLNDSTLQEFANKQGIKDKVSEMTQAQRAYLTEQALLQNTSKIQELAARNTGSLRDEVEQLKGQWHDLVQETGKPLLPKVTETLKGVSDFISNFFVPAVSIASQAWGDFLSLVNKNTGIDIGAPFNAFGDRVSALNQYQTAQRNATDAEKALDETMTRFHEAAQSGFKKTGQSAKDGYKALGDPNKDTEEGEKKLKELRNSLEEVGGTYENVSRDVTQKLISLAQVHRDRMNDIQDSIKSTQQSISDLAKDYDRSLGDISKSEEDLLGTTEEKIADLQKKLDEKGARRESLGQQSNASIPVSLTQEIADLQAQLAQLQSTRDTIKNSLTPEQQSEATRRKDLGSEGRQFEDLEARKKQLKDDHDTRLSQLQDEMDKLNQKKTTEEQAYTSQRTQLQLTRTELDTFANDYATQMANLSTTTEETVKDMKDHLKELQDTISSIDALVGKNGATKTQSSTLDRLTDIPKFGDGGTVYGPTLAIIGEKGPEKVTPLNDRSTSTSSIVINVHIANVSKEADLDQILPALARKIQLQKLQSA
jgi:hypothetical protein